MSGTPDDPPPFPPAPAGTVLGFDFGTRKVGVALGNTVTGAARALLTLHEEGKHARMAAIALLMHEWQPIGLVVGRPLHADGSAHEMTRLAQRFARQLRERFAVPVEEVDERYTTQVAEPAHRALRRSGAIDPGRDAVAAQVILQSWLDTRPRTTS